MGCWGTQPFENDDASDWAYELEEGDLRANLETALNAIADAPADEYIEAPEGCNAIAATQVVAHLAGADPGWYLTEELRALLASSKLRPDAELKRLALAALDRVETPQSELLELWTHPGNGASPEDGAQWRANNAKLRELLQ